MHQPTTTAAPESPQQTSPAAPTPAEPRRPVEIDRKLMEQLPPADPDPDDPACD